MNDIEPALNHVSRGRPALKSRPPASGHGFELIPLPLASSAERAGFVLASQ